MTQYTQTVGKNSNWSGRHSQQTGLLPIAVPSLGTIGGAIASVGGSLGIGTAASRLFSGLKTAGSKAASGGSKVGGAVGGGTATGLAKLGLGTAAIHELNRFMNTGPEIGGVNVLPAAVIGGGILLAANVMLN